MNFPLLSEELSEELSRRLEKVDAAISEAGADALLAASTSSIFYLAGGIFNGYVYIPAAGEPLFLMIPPAKSNSPLARSIRKPEMILPLLEKEGYPLPAKLALEFDDLSWSEIERLKKCFPEASFLNASPLMRKARMTKTPLELAKMREDGRKQAGVYSRIRHCYREEMTDLEFQIEIEHILRLDGCLGYLRAASRRMELNMGSLLSGANADVPSPYDFSMGGAGSDPSLPVGASGRIMHPGETVMVDMNGGFNGYQTDMTRTWSIGTARPEALKAHECSRRILRELEKIALPGVEISLLYRRAVEIAEEEGLADYFMGHAHKVAFIGHGVGIELNEPPVVMERNHSLLEENMTIALEPKFVLPEIGAVGVENTYIVTPEGLENITVLDEHLNEL